MNARWFYYRLQYSKGTIKVFNQQLGQSFPSKTRSKFSIKNLVKVFFDKVLWSCTPVSKTRWTLNTNQSINQKLCQRTLMDFDGLGRNRNPSCFFLKLWRILMGIDQSKNLWIKIYVIKAHEFEKCKQHVKRVFIRSHVVVVFPKVFTCQFCHKCIKTASRSHPLRPRSWPQPSCSSLTHPQNSAP